MTNGQGASPHKSKSGLVRVLRAFGYSMEGLRAALIHEHAFRQELMLAVVLTVAAFFVPATNVGKALLLGSVLLVLIVELLNSAMEAVVDRVSLENHELSKRAKDIGSAAVFVSLVNLIMIWIVVILF